MVKKEDPSKRKSLWGSRAIIDVLSVIKRGTTEEELFNYDRNEVLHVTTGEGSREGDGDSIGMINIRGILLNLRNKGSVNLDLQTGRLSLTEIGKQQLTVMKASLPKIRH